MTHWLSKVGVPGRAVQAIATVKVHHVGYVGEIIVHTTHIIVAQLDPDVILTDRCGRLRPAGRNVRDAYQFLSLVSGEQLVGQVYVYPAHIVARDG